MALTCWDPEEQFRGPKEVVARNVFSVHRHAGASYTTITAVTGFSISVAEDVSAVWKYLNSQWPNARKPRRRGDG